MTKLDVSSPYDNTHLARLPMANESAAFASLERCHKRFQDRNRWLSKSQRLGILERLAPLIETQAEKLALQASREGGKPLVDSRVEVQRGIGGIRVASRELWKLAGREIPMGLNAASAGRFAHTFRQPRGVVLAISAFNHPFNLIVHQVVPAIAAGCPVVVKPALNTPLSCKSFVEALYEVGLPEDYCQMVICENAVAEKLVSDPRMSFLTFIGSAAVGWHLRTRLPAGASCALEHGGVAPAIISDDADLETSIPLLVKGGFYHAGQVCVSVQRIFTAEACASAFQDEIVRQANALVVGDPCNEETEVGPLISPGEVERVHEWVTEATERGGQLLCGGKKLANNCYAPTVILNPPTDARLSREEIFGPVIALYTYKDFDEALAKANAPDVFFQASIFTKDLETALRATRRLQAMAVMVNDHTAFRVDWMPFGGHRQSGLGLGGIGNSMQDMTLERMVVFRSPNV